MIDKTFKCLLGGGECPLQKENEELKNEINEKSEYITDLEEECENQSEYIRVLIEGIGDE